MDRDYLKFILALEYGSVITYELELARDEIHELAGVVVDKYKANCIEQNRGEDYDSFLKYVNELSFADVWKGIGEEKRLNSKTTLSDFLEMFDFSYKVYRADDSQEQALRRRMIDEGELDIRDLGKPLIGLVDEQCANLGDIESDRFIINKNVVESIIERMDIYVNDYVIKEFEEALQFRGIDTSKYDLQEMFLCCKRLRVGEDEVCYALAELVLAPETVFVPELYANREKVHKGDSIFEIGEHPLKPDTRPPGGYIQTFSVPAENIAPLAIALLESTYCFEKPGEKKRLLELAREDIFEENQELVESLFLANGYGIDWSDSDHISELYALEHNALHDLAFFDVVAPYVEKGTELRLIDITGNTATLLFDGMQCHHGEAKESLDNCIASAKNIADRIHKDKNINDKSHQQEEVK